jgi:hypothetical protein
MPLDISRRNMLRGAMFGFGLTVPLPLLDCFLDNHGEALANGAPIPVRFCTYFWGCGLTAPLWVPKTAGRDYAMPPQLAGLEPVREQVSVFSGFNVDLDGRANQVHWSGQGSVLCGAAPPTPTSFAGASCDAVVSEGARRSRFRALDVTPFGDDRLSHSTRDGQTFSTPDVTPLQLYMRLFGDRGPAGQAAGPDPETLLRKSVLSTVTDPRKELMASVGTRDRAKLDQYFSGLRDLEEELAADLVGPSGGACVSPKKPTAGPAGAEISTILRVNRQMTDLVLAAMRCNQAHVFNVLLSSGTSAVYLPGDATIYHQHTHEEPVDPGIGYQPISSKLATQSFTGFADFVKALADTNEGDRSILDRSLVLGYTDTGDAKVHSLDNIPLFLAGRAGGRHKPGSHIQGGGNSVSRVILTALQAMDLPLGSWGAGAMMSDKPVTEVLM